MGELSSKNKKAGAMLGACMFLAFLYMLVAYGKEQTLAADVLPHEEVGPKGDGFVVDLPQPEALATEDDDEVRIGASFTGNGIVDLQPNTSICDCVKRSSLFSPVCKNTHFEGVYPFLVTSTGRSGTDYLHAELRKLGLVVSHDGGVEPGQMVGAVSWPQAFSITPFLTHLKNSNKPKEKYCPHTKGNLGGKSYGFRHVFHLVRHPIKTIQSRFNVGRIKVFQTQNQCNTGTRLNSTLDRMGRRLHITLQHWIYWNSFIERHAEFRFQLEELGNREAKHRILKEIVTRAGLDKMELDGFDMSMVDERIDQANVDPHKNSGHTIKPEKPLNWRQLARLSPYFTAMAQIQAIRYGYEIPPKDLVPAVWDERDKSVLKVQRCFFLYYGGGWKCALYSEACG